MPCSSVSIVNFEHAIAGWDATSKFEVSHAEDSFKFIFVDNFVTHFLQFKV